MKRLYLDDIRTPEDNDWIVVRNYNEFVDYILNNGIPELISFDHDLAEEHMSDYFRNQYNGINGIEVIEYGSFKEKTGMDAAKWLIEYCLDNNLELKNITVHSANPCGSENILGIINNFKKHKGQEADAFRTFYPIQHINDF